MVDVIIPTYKPDTELIKILDMLCRQSVKPHRIILVNTVSEYLERLFKEEAYTPDTGIIEIHNIEKDEFDHGGTRAMAAGYSETDIMLYMTQDAVPADEDFISRLIKPLEDEMVAASYARQLPKEGSGIPERITREFNYPEASCIKSAADTERLGIKTYFCSNVACAYRRDIYDRLGGFVHKTIFNEDMIYAGTAVKAGYRIAYSADAMVYHSHDYSAAEQFRRNVDIGVSQAEHPEIFSGLSSESEGKKLVKLTIGRLASSGKLISIPGYIWMIVCRYAGYLIGKHYRSFPVRFIKSVSLNPDYFG